MMKDLSSLFDSSNIVHVNCHCSLASSSGTAYWMYHQEQCSESIVFLVLDLRDRTKSNRSRFKPSDDSLTWDEIAIVVA